MFELTPEQLKAAKDAMYHASPSDFAHLILYLIGIAAMTWFFLMLIGVWHELQNNHIDFTDALTTLSAAVFILICAGALIVF